MNKSNVKIYSNVYVVEKGNKTADKKFMSQVVDPNALTLLKSRLGSDTLFSKLQRDIVENALPCAYAERVNGEKDYTHGTIKENGEYVFVNTCENTGCRLYPRCSAEKNFRKIVRDETVTPLTIGRTEEKDSIRYMLGKRSKVVKYKHFQSLKPKREVELREETILPDGKHWFVRGHWRELYPGERVWVRGHFSHHICPEGTFVRSVVKTGFFYGPKSTAGRRATLEWVRRAWEKRKAKERGEEIVSLGARRDAAAQVYQLKNIRLLDDPRCIIESALSSRILVNAGPGTGKTHTVIERLKYISLHCGEEVDLESVLILCFSRSAVKVIRQRLERAMNDGEIPYTASRLTISTFDSFATWYIMQVEPNYNLSGFDYDERIRLFIAKYKFDTSILNESLSYLIVDEVQDLVGVRAELVQTLLENIRCGFLLLGDECQAIYDYQIKDSDWQLNAAKLYEWLESHFQNKLEEYELLRNWRNQGKIGDDLKPVRRAMLAEPFERQQQEMQKFCDKYRHELELEELYRRVMLSPEERFAVLSWSNADTYRQSQKMYGYSGVKCAHTVLTSARFPSYRPEIAAILHDYTLSRLSFQTFAKRCSERGLSDSLASDIWTGMCYTSGVEADEEEISIADLKQKMLADKHVSEYLTVQKNARITLSTIHKAKGQEYDDVIINNFNKLSSTDSIKVYYVAATRAKSTLLVSEKKHSIRSRKLKERYFELSWRRYIRKVEFGIEGDIDPIGFVDKTLPGMAVEERQDYIAKHISEGDAIAIRKQNGRYLIEHEGHYIGEVRREVFDDIAQCFARYHQVFNDSDFEKLYVKNVVTIVNRRIDQRIAESYNASGFWYGIEFWGISSPAKE